MEDKDTETQYKENEALSSIKMTAIVILFSCLLCPLLIFIGVQMSLERAIGTKMDDIKIELNETRAEVIRLNTKIKELK